MFSSTITLNIQTTHTTNLMAGANNRKKQLDFFGKHLDMIPTETKKDKSNPTEFY